MAILMAAGMASAQAGVGTDSHVEVAGNVVPMSCNVGPGSGSPYIVSLGNATPDQFIQVGGVYDPLYVVPMTEKRFQVTVNGCAGATPDDGDHLNIRVSAQGKTLNQSQTLFGGGTGQTSDAGATLLAVRNAKGAITTGNLLADGDEVTAYVYSAGEDTSAADGSFIEFETPMASESSKPVIGGIDAPITFTVDYQ